MTERSLPHGIPLLFSSRSHGADESLPVRTAQMSTVLHHGYVGASNHSPMSIAARAHLDPDILAPGRGSWQTVSERGRTAQSSTPSGARAGGRRRRHLRREGEMAQDAPRDVGGLERRDQPELDTAATVTRQHIHGEHAPHLATVKLVSGGDQDGFRRTLTVHQPRPREGRHQSVAAGVQRGATEGRPGRPDARRLGQAAAIEREYNLRRTR